MKWSVCMTRPCCCAIVRGSIYLPYSRTTADLGLLSNGYAQFTHAEHSAWRNITGVLFELRQKTAHGSGQSLRVIGRVRQVQYKLSNTVIYLSSYGRFGSTLERVRDMFSVIVGRND